MKILVTGSSGTIGTRLCERLLDEKYDVVGADWRPCKWQKAVEDIRVDIDLRDPQMLTTRCAKLKADIVIHLAANARVYELVSDPDRARDNVLTTYNVLEFARKQGIPRFFLASSRETYGNIAEGALREDMARIENCESAYTASKIAGEAFAEAYRRCYNLQTVIFRFSNVYGMYDDSNRVIPLFIRQAHAGERMTVFGRDKCLDFTYIDDAVTGVMLALRNFEKAEGRTFNIASGRGTTLVELAETVKKLLKSTSEIAVAPPRIGEVTHYVADITRARESLGYAPKVPFDEGVRRSVEWYMSVKQ